jgi:hypothetical protein
MRTQGYELTTIKKMAMAPDVGIERVECRFFRHDFFADCKEVMPEESTLCAAADRVNCATHSSPHLAHTRSFRQFSSAHPDNAAAPFRLDSALPPCVLLAVPAAANNMFT